MQVLLVEDDKLIRDNMIEMLKREGFVVKHASDGESAIKIYKHEPVDIIILVLGLPDIDGIQVLKKIRKKNATIPILLLTARDSIEEKVIGLDAGADDYITKPFNIEELMARLRVLERRLGTASSSEIVIGGITLDTAKHIVISGEENLILSRREYMLLKVLMESAGAIQSKQNIEDKLYNWGEEVASNTIEVHVSNLRKKLPAGFIQTIRGLGYMVKKK